MRNTGSGRKIAEHLDEKSGINQNRRPISRGNVEVWQGRLGGARWREKGKYPGKVKLLHLDNAGARVGKSPCSVKAYGKNEEMIRVDTIGRELIIRIEGKLGNPFVLHQLR
jgi:hypothetical protein